MKMNLKNKNLKKTKNQRPKMTTTNLLIFLISFSIITIVLGIIFCIIIKNSDKEIIISTVKQNFEIKENYNYIKLLKDEIISNTYNIFMIWLLGLSVIGVLANIFIYFCQMFSTGFTISSIFSAYKTKGIIANLIYLIPSKISYIIILFIITLKSIKISIKISKQLFTKEEINLKKEIKKYMKFLIVSWIAIIAISMLKVFLDPILINIFTKM